MPLDEDDAEPWQRLAAPAHRRPAAMRTIEDLDRRRQEVPASARIRPRPARRRQPAPRLRAASRRRAAATPRSRSGAAPPHDRRTPRDVAGRDAAIVGQDTVAPDDQRALVERRVALAREGDRLEAREPFRWMRRLELALIAELHRRPERADVVLDRLLHLLRREQPPEFLHHPRRRVDLRVLDAGREPDAADRQAALRRRLDERRPRLA